jgi:phage antirepressor YoqD-like protein
MSQLVSTVDLIEWSEIKQRNKLIEWLRDNHIAYRLNRSGNPITTVEAINDSLKTTEDEVIDF